MKFNSVNSLYLIINKITRYIEESSENKYFTLIPTDESEDTLKKYGDLWTKIRNLINSKTNNSDDYHNKYVKIKSDLDDDLPLKKSLELQNTITVATAVFHEEKKYYPQVFPDECLYKL